MADDEPIFDLSDDEQWTRVGGYLQKCRRDAIDAKRRGRKTGFIFRVVIRLVRNLRTKEQNAYYWGVVLPHLAAAVRHVNGERDESYNSEDAHEDCKSEFLIRYLHHPGTGEVVGSKRRSTTVLTTVEFYDYVERIRERSAYLGVPIPAPDPDWKEKANGERRTIDIDERPVHDE
jgi:hypothetical protein